MMGSLCDPELWPWPWISRSNFEKDASRDGSTYWHGTKGMWVYRKLGPICDFGFLPHPWPWPWIFKVKFWKSCIWRMGVSINIERKGVSWFDVEHSMWSWAKPFTLDFQGQILKNNRPISYIPRCTCSIMCKFLFRKVVHCGIWVRGIWGSVRLVYVWQEVLLISISYCCFNYKCSW